MRKLLILLCVLCSLLILSGCGASDNAGNSSPSASGEQSAASVTEYFKEDVVRCFQSTSENDGCTVTASAVAEDGAENLMGVVLYTDRDGNSCNLSFVDQAGTASPVGIAADGSMSASEDSDLTYTGNGSISLLLHDNSGTAYQYAVTYSKNESGSNFDISSQKLS